MDSSDVMFLQERQRLAAELAKLEETEATLTTQVSTTKQRAMKVEYSVQREERRRARLQQQVHEAHSPQQP